ncbi:diguanylate cyclase [Thiomicrorhabdus sp. ZW0627]|uniref:sensor domain-containing diguanylate cyclase n=1 Tax=Thiomicrorhabdus sp. ZW0627 TaxID=3039774 RepID=UPI0024365547|nr:diguanylate cyclase [Thiomicrorhabdus sp. ZW0627]MDG6773068.1 diguanylate cyclase [Thiomicrorhabdus sp. ZW0627]
MSSRYNHASLEEADATLGYILDIVSDGVWDWNATTGHVQRSPGWYRMLGYEVNSFEESVFTWENVIHPDDYEKVMQHFEAYIRGDINEYRIQYRCRKADGSYLWIEDSGKIVARSADGNVERMIGAHTDINEEKNAQKKLRRQNQLLQNDNSTLESLINQRAGELIKLNHKLKSQVEEAQYNASHDVLTGAFNRRCFEERFHQELDRVKRYAHPLSVILVDVDDFKVFNDNYGHKMGDEVLRCVANLLKQHLRDSDLLARWGGEEFIAILPNTKLEQAAEKAEQLRQIIANTHFLDKANITCSFGVTAYTQGDTSDSIFSRADKALYKAKSLNRNNIQTI